ncbi:hypothetical protein ANN_20660 [Periplaneta americana]|uniref:Uncharacterized protein n=1 Tax=Periplaneta americana TaxID=6978 RepID=A0ABQ8SE29_PERAM|nr:hypothetical protein ANN_20660 [Periplaneta americana]
MAGLCEGGNEPPGSLKANKFRATECTERKKSVRWPTKVAEDAIEWMQRGPKKSVKKLAVEIGVSYGSAHKRPEASGVAQSVEAVACRSGVALGSRFYSRLDWLGFSEVFPNRKTNVR